MLAYGSETWALREADKIRIEAVEMRFMSRTAGVTLRDRMRSEDMRNNLRVMPAKTTENGGGNT